MERNNKIYSSSDVQRRLWQPLGGENLLQRKIDLAKRGMLPDGKELPLLEGDECEFSTLLGEFAPKVLIASNPNSGCSLVPEQLAVAGGWCAIRTKDVENISNAGVIMNPVTGELEKVSSVSQVADWIPRAIAFDQIIESVGAVNAREYAVISERRLWSQRLSDKVEAILGKLSSEERDELELSVETAERIKAELTARYIEYVTGKDRVIFQRVVDDDIWEDLEKARDDMLRQVGLTVEKLETSNPRQKNTLQSSSLVWAMYSQPYLDMLRQKGYIQNQKAFVVEPAMHAALESEAEKEMGRAIYWDKGKYMDQRGFNNDTGFIAYIECLTGNGRNVRKELAAGQVPNISNWNSMLQTNGILDPERNCVLNPADNNLYLWGVNFLPLGSTQRVLLELADIQQIFRDEKTRLSTQFMTNGKGADPSARGRMQQKTETLKAELIDQVRERNFLLARDLRAFFSYITEGIEV